MTTWQQQDTPASAEPAREHAPRRRTLITMRDDGSWRASRKLPDRRLLQIVTWRERAQQSEAFATNREADGFSDTVATP